MTVIAWDGKTIAADRQASNGNTKRQVTKLSRLEDGSVITFTGNLGLCLRRQDWFLNGADPDEWPEMEGEENYSCLIVCDKRGCLFYEQAPFPQKIETRFWAFGCGRDFAIAAMALGRSAREAVELACRFDNGCGMGVDVMTLETEAGQIGN